MKARIVVICCVALLLALLAVGARLLAAAGVPEGGGGTPHGATEPSPSRPTPSRPTLTAPSSSPAATSTAGATTLPDGFVVRRLAPGERPPQFVLVSFDGVGWDRLWDYWLAVGERVPFRFTGFLSGTYLLSDRTRDAYHPPYYPAGTSAIGWTGAADLPFEIANLNRALAAGEEIGTHFNGHFCASAGLPSGGDTWTTRDWNDELDQFFHLLRDYRTDNRADNRLPASVRLDVTADDIHGERTPCLEGSPEALFPALRRHGLDFDSSFTRSGLAWPTKSPEGIWRMGMATFPMHGRIGGPVTTMDYNYYFEQHGALDAGVSAAESMRDGRQVLATYRDLYAAAVHGNRAPLVLGNHFNEWNHGAYRDALADFVLETCGRPEARCVTYSDLIAWLDAQRPAVVRRLQALPPELG